MPADATRADAGTPSPSRESLCSRCDSVCCRLTVVLMPEDRVPRHFVVRNEQGVEIMARNEDGWCAAVDPLHMRCSIYAERPAICRGFTMGAAYCLDIRDTYRDQQRRGIPLTLY